MDLTWGLRWPQKAIRVLTSGLWEIRVFFFSQILKSPGVWNKQMPSLRVLVDSTVFQPSEVFTSQTPPQLQQRSLIQSYASHEGFLSESRECRVVGNGYTGLGGVPTTNSVWPCQAMQGCGVSPTDIGCSETIQWSRSQGPATATTWIINPFLPGALILDFEKQELKRWGDTHHKLWAD